MFFSVKDCAFFSSQYIEINLLPFKRDPWMAQQWRALAVLAEDPSLVLCSHIRQLRAPVITAGDLTSSGLGGECCEGAPALMYTHPYIDTHIIKNKIKQNLLSLRV